MPFRLRRVEPTKRSGVDLKRRRQNFFPNSPFFYFVGQKKPLFSLADSKVFCIFISRKARSRLDKFQTK